MFWTTCRNLATCILVAAAVFLSGCAATGKGSGGVNAPDQADKPYLILISIDGFRWDYQDLYPSPAIDSLTARGIRAQAMAPVFPALTFPNHYSVATGLLPSHHGLVANDFKDSETGEWFHSKDRTIVQDGSWYGGEPIWVTAEKKGMVTAAYYFVGTEADIRGIRPTHWYGFDPEVSGEDRVDKVLEWLAEPAGQRPHLITLYFEEVDDYSHRYGPGSQESIEAIERVDGYLQRLLDGLERLPHGKDAYLVLVSDHGQGEYDPRGHSLIMDQTLDISGISFVEGGPYAFLYFDEPDPERQVTLTRLINERWVCGHAYVPAEAPERWRISDNPRNPDIIAVADPGCAVFSTVKKRDDATPGDHGWAPDIPDMHGIFIAAGPRLPQDLTIGTINAVDVYPLLMAVLGLQPPGPIDGDPDLLPGLLLPE